MRTSIYILALTSIMVASLVGLTGCKRCQETQVKTYEYFRPYYYNWLMGFEGHESLSFIKNNKDTVIFKGQGLQSYYTEVGYARGDCEDAYRLLNHKVRFTNKTEGELLFHYYISTPASEFSETFELIFKTQQFINPIFASDYYKHSSDTNLVMGGIIRRFASDNSDSIYLNNSYTDNPKKRVFRIKLNNNIYDVVP